MPNDSSFFTNEEGFTLADRFGDLVKQAELFDALVGYFYSSGFHAIYRSLENTDKIRILIGISTSQETFNLINQGNQVIQGEFIPDAQTIEKVGERIEAEMADSEDTKTVESGVQKFIEWIRSDKLIIRAYPSQNIHAKLYIVTFKEGFIDKGRVITGSSNFTRSGLIGNLEFNVELKDRSDYDFAINKFNDLWDQSVDVSDKYVETIEEKTWFSDKIIPYHLYLKLLYEYFKKQLNQADKINLPYTPANFEHLDYQEQAVLNAKKILNEYGGVFISDVVGLGKTYIASMLARQLDGRHLVIAPPNLLDENNPGSWTNAFIDFGNSAKFQSIGKLDNLLDGKADKFKNVFIDEAHRMRNPDTETYTKLAEICRGKRVILVSATPYNNTPKDILSLIGLFQNPRKSTIPNQYNLELFFGNLDKRIQQEDRRVNQASYIQTTKENAKEVRNKILRHLMVRRTRSDIKKCFPEDLKKQGLNFPDVEQPIALHYELNKKENEIFEKTIYLIATKLRYARYMPMIDYDGKDFNESAKQGQRNLGDFMKILLVKRLESSFFAFRNSIDRFLEHLETFIETFENGSVYISKGYSNKILELLASDNPEAIHKLIVEEKAKPYKSKDFKPIFKEKLYRDKEILEEIQGLWKNINHDPKIDKLIDELKNNDVLRDHHLIIFTESKETARYLSDRLEEIFPSQVIRFDGDSSAADKKKVINNFDAKVLRQEDEYRILIATEVLAEGVNLHRSCVVINYDIPWNPTRLMQRIGRINRIDTEFKKIYTFNFFPSYQGDKQLALEDAAKAKIAGFLELLGGDAKLLTEGEEIDSHALYDLLNTIPEDEEPDTELIYLKIIKDIRENDPDLFDMIKQLPKKARTAKKSNKVSNSFITFFRKGGVQKFFIANQDSDSKELDFIEAANLIASLPNTKKEKIPGEMFELLEKNNAAFQEILEEEEPELKSKGGSYKSKELFKLLKVIKKNSKQFTDFQDEYLSKVLEKIDEGGLTKKTISNTLNAVKLLGDEINDPLIVINTVRDSIPENLLEDHFVDNKPKLNEKSEVVLSMYLKKQ